MRRSSGFMAANLAFTALLTLALPLADIVPGSDPPCFKPHAFLSSGVLAFHACLKLSLNFALHAGPNFLPVLAPGSRLRDAFAFAIASGVFETLFAAYMLCFRSSGVIAANRFLAASLSFLLHSGLKYLILRLQTLPAVSPSSAPRTSASISGTDTPDISIGRRAPITACPSLSLNTPSRSD